MKYSKKFLIAVLATATLCVGFTACGAMGGGTSTESSGEAHPHTWNERVTKEATCEESGVLTYSCYCGESYTIALEAIGHEIMQHQAKAATCESAGWEAYETCERGNCHYTSYKEVPALGHDLSSVEEIVATCEESGWTAYASCNRCEYETFPEEIPAFGHNYDGNECLNCGNLIDSEGLTYKLSSDGSYYMVTGIGTCKDKNLVIPAIHEDLPVKQIGNGVYVSFKNQSQLTSVRIPNSVTTIEDEAFYGCYNLRTVVLGESVKSLGSRAFAACYKLVEIINKSPSITIDGNNQSHYLGYHALGIYNSSNKFTETKLSIENGYTVYKEGKKTILISYDGEETDLVIPSYVTEIHQYAFYKSNTITSVVIGNSVTSIGEGAFLDCTSLANIEIGNAVTNIDRSAFANTEYYNKASNWEEGVLYIGNYVIAANNNIPTAYTIKEGTVCIADGAFAGGYEESIVIPVSVVNIGYEAFYYGSLKTITYNGTKAQWDAIDKESSWSGGVYKRTLICTDGTYTL